MFAVAFDLSTPGDASGFRPSIIRPSASIELASASELLPHGYCRSGGSNNKGRIPECWTNINDGDVEGEDGTVIIRSGGEPSVIFDLPGEGIYTLEQFGVLTDTGIGEAGAWLNRFAVLVSTDGQSYRKVNSDQFRPTIKDAKAQSSGMEYFDFPRGTTAARVKVVFLSSHDEKSPWIHVGEVSLMGSRLYAQ